MEIPLMKYAMEYRDKYGFSVIPLGADKRPLCEWTEYQKRKPTDDELEAWNRDYPKANLGIVTGSISNLAVVDIDEQCGYEAIKKYIPDELKRPTVRTRKGTHYYFRHAEGLRNNARVITGCDLRAEGGYVVAPPSTIDGHQYKFIEKLSQIPIPLIPQAYVDAVTYKKSSAPVQVTGEMFAKGRRDEDLFHVAHQLVKAETDENAIRQVLYILGKHCGFSQNDIEMKIVSAMKRSDIKHQNVTAMVRDFIDGSHGMFYTTDIYSALCLTDAKHKDTVRQLVNRWEKKGDFIVKVDGRNGCYRKVDNDLDIIELDELQDCNYVELPLPLSLSSLVKVMPRNQIVVAGAADAGKTAFMLTILKNWVLSHYVTECHGMSRNVTPDVTGMSRMNGENGQIDPKMSRNVTDFGVSNIYSIDFKNLYNNKNLISENLLKTQLPTLDYNQPLNCNKLRYITSEMSMQELVTKVVKLGLPIEVIKNCVTFIDRSTNFPDAIEPNSINIIDYLEITDGQFYMIGNIMRQIHDKLRDGVCFIAIQKDEKSRDGRGGAFTREKPRLVVALDQGGKATITKAKLWRNNETNPNNLQCRYTCIDGVLMNQTEQWALYANEGI